MLQTQVAYWNMMENKRHNKATERQAINELKQTIKYNSDQVQYWRGQLAELTRHNKMTERLSKGELATKRAQATAALKSAEAALQQSMAALQNAETNAAVGSATITEKLAKAKESKAKTKETKQKTKLSKATTKLKEKEGKWYGITQVVLPTVKTLTSGYKDVTSGTADLIQSVTGPKKRK